MFVFQVLLAFGMAAGPHETSAESIWWYGGQSPIIGITDKLRSMASKILLAIPYAVTACRIGLCGYDLIVHSGRPVPEI